MGRPQGYNFETGVYRPPSEGGSDSLLVRFTRNCPWNHCTFCGMYKNEKFELRSLEEIKGDIDAMAQLVHDLKELSLKTGKENEIAHEGAVILMRRVPDLEYHNGFPMVYQWLLSGGKTAFLQDANSPIMKVEPLAAALKYLRETFPTLNRVTSYARSKTLAKKKPETLKIIRKAGLDRLHLGLESGDEEVLEMIKKGATPESHIEGGQKAIAAGFQVSEYWMPGVGGKACWENHARNTARVLNDINPHYIRSRPFRLWPGTPLHQAARKKEFIPLSPREQLQELKLTMETLNVSSKVCFDHAGNHWKNRRGGYLFSHSYEGYQFPEEKQRVLALINEGLECQRH
ncbi:MAG: radical SAM protein [Desulfobacteraceae bacterium 4572_87]|nr:MAG: radical SAM protein [Desulfobacteraceae bacterium 4572_87]